MLNARTLLFSCVVAGCLALAAVSPAPAQSSRVAFSVSPAKVKDGGLVTVKAAHLKAHRFFTLLLSTGHSGAGGSGFIGVAQADGHGTLMKSAKLPIVVYCGKVSVYLIQQGKVVAKTRVTLTGCKASPNPGGPPPKP